MLDILEFIFNEIIIYLIVISLVAVIIIKIKDHFLNRVISKALVMKSKKKVTYLKLISSGINYLIIIFSFILILQHLGVNVTSILAGLGVVSLIAGLALQDALKDVIMGFNIIVDNYYTVGDVIKINNITGKVLEIGIKTTTLRDITSNNILVIGNRNIGEALKISNWLDIDIPLPYEEKITRIEKIIAKISEIILEDKKVKEVEYHNIDSFGDSAINYRLRIICSAEHREDVKRRSLRIIKMILDEEKIAIPYNQLDVHSDN